MANQEAPGLEVINIYDGDILEISLPNGSLVMDTPKMKMVIHASKVKVITPKAFTLRFLLRNLYRSIFKSILVEQEAESETSRSEK